MKTLRILWITHDVFECFEPFVKGNPTKGGSWVAPLFYNIKNQPGIKLGAITPVVNGIFQKKEIDNVIYYSVRIKNKDNLKVIDNRIAHRYLHAIKDFNPDIIHIHGTEKNFGLLRSKVDERIPIVCSIQGIVTPCYDFLKLSIANIDLRKYRSVKNIIGKGGVNSLLRSWGKYRTIEKDIYKINQYFIGRTSWDKAYLKRYNSNAKYFHGEELLRSSFYNEHWKLDDCERYRIFVSSASYPLKGFHDLIHAVALLKDQYPNIKIIAPLSSVNMRSSFLKDYLFTEDYRNYIKHEIKRLRLEDNVVFLNRLSAGEMVSQFKKAHVFVLPSYIENSPNSLGESMNIGTPSIVTNVGGISSIVQDYNSALFYSPGDYVTLASKLDHLFSDDILALKISENAKNKALERHDIKNTVVQYYSIYKTIIDLHNESFAYTLRA